MALNLETRIVTRRSDAAQRVYADIVVLGAGIAGVSAALEAARLGRRVALIDGAPTRRTDARGASGRRHHRHFLWFLQQWAESLSGDPRHRR
jgi:glycine/D-amino acid oxidase-like deaminating enzyme